ncbi:MAG: NUDIX hydrolase [Chryseolinea sp.]
MSEEISKIYGNRVRVRVCGLLHHRDRLLLVNHSLQDRPIWWGPPGGGVEFGESLEDALKREFLEETKLSITVGQFAFGCEFLEGPLHAIELFFHVSKYEGSPETGQDPEMPLIADVRFMTSEEIASLPGSAIHGIFQVARTKSELLQLKGFFRI